MLLYNLLNMCIGGVSMRDILIVIEAILAVIIMISILVQPSKSDALSGFVPEMVIHFLLKIKVEQKKLD